MAGKNGSVFTLVQLSDLHCGTQFFLPNLLERAIAEVNELAPDVVIVSGDLTTHGFKDEYALAKRYLDTIECESMVVIPGNHDSRNVGYVHFEELFGERNSVLRCNGVSIVAVDSTEPDLETGRSAAADTAGSTSSSPSPPTCASSSSTITCYRCRAPGASATSSTTPV